MIKHHIVTLFLLFIILTNSFSKVPLGYWDDHLSYNDCVDIVQAGDKIYGATTGGLFFIDLADNSINKLSTVQGLSDVNISRLAYSKKLDVLIIGYVNGNIDLIKGNSIINLNEIIRKQIIGDKTITSVFLSSDEKNAYITTGFGIVLLNLEKEEITETYFLGDSGTPMQVNSIVVFKDSVYASTNAGLYKAPAKGANLINHTNWNKLTTIPNSNDTFKNLFILDDKLYAHQYKEHDTNNIYVFDGSLWNLWLQDTNSIYNAGVVDSRIFVSSNLELKLFNSSAELQERLKTLFSKDIIEINGQYWIADGLWGIIKYKEGTENFGSFPNGPSSNSNIKATYLDGKIFIAGGGRTEGWNNAWVAGTVYSYDDNKWESKVDYSIRDVVNITVDPENSNRLFFGTWGYGVYELDWENKKVLNFYDSTNTKEHSLKEATLGEGNIRIGGMSFDVFGNLWVVNSSVANPVSVLKSNGDWVTFPYGNVFDSDFAGDILISRSGLKWIILPRKDGIFLLDSGEDIDIIEDDVRRKFSIIDEEGGTFSNIHSIAEDNDGYMWIGTSSGPFVYYNPDDLLIANYVASRIKIPRNDGTPFADILLENEVITAIEVDGANRKWFGTANSGVFLMSADGLEQIHHFDKDNSPLGSNAINDIVINGKTGEVFFLTRAGIYSYRESATEGNIDFQDVHVFPNPVRENYNGYITVTGLVGNVNVKITDISGNLVYETRALGGQAVWDGKNFDGIRVKSGIYLVFCTNEDGSKIQVTKIAFIN